MNPRFIVALGMVTRDFKSNGWLRIKGATWFLLKKEELEKLVTT